MMAVMEVTVRPAQRDDHADALLYESAKPYYDAYAGGERRARALLRGVWPRRAHAASYEVCRVAELNGTVVGVLAGFPVANADPLARRFVTLTLPRIPPWRWRRLFRHLSAASAVSPHPPPSAYYVDALAVDKAWRRRGVARALLAEAERLAAEAGSTGVALDTGIANAPARALYEGYGFEQRELRRAPDDRAAAAIGGPGFIGYFKPLTR
jgi:ribosomal protein S18 acetylase RimI-like enzyme